MSNETQTSVEQWVFSLCENNPQCTFESVDRAYRLISEQITPNPDIYGLTPLALGHAIAQEVDAMNGSQTLIIAALVYPSIQYGTLPATEIEKKLGDTVWGILKNAKQIDSLKERFSATKSEIIESLRKVILAIIDDVQIVIIKLAEHIAILRQLQHSDSDKRRLIAEHVKQIYAPLANRLGIGHIKWQLEDLSFRILQPEAYHEITQALTMRRSERDSYTRAFIEQLNNLLKKHNIKTCHVQGRAKHIFSIYKKMTQKNLQFHELYDTLAFRITTDTIESCYAVLSIIQAQWTQINSEYDDYIAKPKPNGYQSIHTAVVGPNQLNIEIQIRTQDMHDKAELGIAAHWKYKEQDHSLRDEHKIHQLRELLSWQHNHDDQHPDSALYSSIFSDRVYVFTPLGDVYDLPQGATPIDFAYLLHTDLGHCCQGAKINGKLMPLTYQLKTGDHVSIIKSTNGHPSRDWLNPQSGYLTTPHALKKVRLWFKKDNYKFDLEHGKQLWEKHCQRYHYDAHAIDTLHTRFNFKNKPDLLAAIGRGELHISTITNEINRAKKGPSPEKSNKKIHIKEAKQQGLIIDGYNNIHYSLAKCCTPIFGDTVCGYITRSGKITVHRASCQQYIKKTQTMPERIISTKWTNTNISGHFKAAINIVMRSSDTNLKDITGYITQEKIQIADTSIYHDKNKGTTHIQIQVIIPSTTDLDSLIKLLKKIPHVINATRKHQ